MGTILITGATGFLGKEIARCLLAQDAATEIVALVRADGNEALEHRWRNELGAVASAHHDRMYPVRGDITRPRLGLTTKAYAALVEKIDRVVHVAATTRMDLPLVEARRRNVGGTKEVLALCHALRRRGCAGRLDYVSTAYVAGDRRDIVSEDELGAGQRFRNTYEHSKFEAERLCRRAQGELPIAIYRPAIVVGDSTTGETESYKAFYQPLARYIRFYDRWRSVLTRLVPLPVRPECPLDLVPVDYVAYAIVKLLGRAEAAGKCFHLACGRDAPTIAEVVELTCRYFGVPRPRFLGTRSLAALERLAQPGAPLGRASPLFMYAFRNPRFDTTNAQRAGLTPPGLNLYFPHLLRHAYGTDFGRRGGAEAPTRRNA